jgi:hypothetical protein
MTLEFAGTSEAGVNPSSAGKLLDMFINGGIFANAMVMIRNGKIFCEFYRTPYSLTMTSGSDGKFKGNEYKDVIKKFLHTPVLNKPGEKFAYNTDGVNVLHWRPFSLATAFAAIFSG